MLPGHLSVAFFWFVFEVGFERHIVQGQYSELFGFLGCFSVPGAALVVAERVSDRVIFIAA